MFNKVIMVGNLCKDPELRYLASGTPVTNMRIAVSSKYKKDDEWKEETLFIDVVVFGNQAEACNQYLFKGRPILAEGKLQERTWETDGQKRSKVEIVANTIKFLGGREDKADAAPAAAPPVTSGVQPF